MFKKIIFFLIFMSSDFVYSQCNPDYCWPVYIDKLYVNSNGIIYIGTDGDESVLNCGAVSGVYVTLDLSDPGGDAIYSTLLTAQTTNKKVSIQVADGVTGCPIQYVTLDRV